MTIAELFVWQIKAFKNKNYVKKIVWRNVHGNEKFFIVRECKYFDKTVVSVESGRIRDYGFEANVKNY